MKDEGVDGCVNLSTSDSHFFICNVNVGLKRDVRPAPKQPSKSELDARPPEEWELYRPIRGS